MPSELPNRYHVIVSGRAGCSALALATDAGYALPGWVSHDDDFWEDARPLNRRMRELFGLRVAMLRACSLVKSPERRDSYYVAECLDRAWQPPDGARWINARDVERLPWRDELDREVLTAWFAEQPAPQRVAWYRSGWIDVAREWILAAIEDAGYQPTAEVEQVRSWERSSIMRVATDAGLLYFKVVAPQWGHEPSLTQYLSTRFPELMPEVVAADPDSGRMLVREFPGGPLPDCHDLNVWANAYAALGRVQRELAGSIDELSSLGVPMRPPAAILQQIPEMLLDTRRMRVGMDGGLSGDDVALLQAAESRLVKACRRLASGPVPLSLDHGDFWPGNIYAGEGRTTLFDWSDATITHPFFSLVMAAGEIDGCLPDRPGASRRVIDAYLNEWLDVAPLAELQAIFEDAMLVVPLHLAMMYRTVYLPAMEFVDELDRMTPHFLRWLVAELARTGGTAR